jgi:hypothetical protein
MLSLTLKIKDCVLVGNQVWQLTEVDGSKADLHIAQGYLVRVVTLDDKVRDVPYRSDKSKVIVQARVTVLNANRIRIHIYADMSVQIRRFSNFKKSNAIEEKHGYSYQKGKKAG